jgi:hypothetical protein
MGKRTCSIDGCGDKHYAHGWCRRHYQNYRAEMQQRTCSVEGCGEGHYARGLCRLHWQRQRKNGDPRADMPKRPWGQQGCSFPGCEEPHTGKGFCHKHWQRQQKHGDPNHVQYSGWRGDDVGYIGQHQRIYRLRGPALEQLCRQCGAQAEEWAYDHADLNEKLDPKRGPYSLDPNHYLPLCVLCHRRSDRKGWT